MSPHVMLTTFAVLGLLSGCAHSSWSGAPPPAKAAAIAAPAAAPGEAKLTIVVTSSTAAFAHRDGLAGQTVREASGGWRSLMLLRHRGDRHPLVLMARTRPVAVGFDNGARTVLASVRASALLPGRYRLARFVQTHSRFRVRGAHHDASRSQRGTFLHLQVTSDGTVIDGRPRDAGYYQSTFVPATSGGASIRRSGNVPLIPAPVSDTAGAWAVRERGEWAVYFPIDLRVDAPLSRDRTLSIGINMHRAFRWRDVSGRRFSAGVFDATDSFFEPVIRLGGNRFDLRLL